MGFYYRLEERRGLSEAGMQDRREMEDFNSFIYAMELSDIPILGRRFTWFRPNGQALSRLDRFLVTTEWVLS